MSSQKMDYTLFTCDRCGEEWKNKDHLHSDTMEISTRTRSKTILEIPNADLCWRCAKEFHKFMEAKAHLRDRHAAPEVVKT